MSTTSELVERLRKTTVHSIEALDVVGEAADRIEELERGNAKLKDEVEFLHLRRGQLVIERDKAREALDETILDLRIYTDIGVIVSRTIERRAALTPEPTAPATHSIAGERD